MSVSKLESISCVKRRNWDKSKCTMKERQNNKKTKQNWKGSRKNNNNAYIDTSMMDWFDRRFENWKIMSILTGYAGLLLFALIGCCIILCIRDNRKLRTNLSQLKWPSWLNNPLLLLKVLICSLNLLMSLMIPYVMCWMQFLINMDDVIT